MTVTIKWRSFGPEEPFTPMMKGTRQFDCRFNLADASLVQDAVQELAEDYFADVDLWFEWFGDDDSGDIIVEIIEPTEVAGFHAVSMRRVIEARATAIPDPRIKQ